MDVECASNEMATAPMESNTTMMLDAATAPEGDVSATTTLTGNEFGSDERPKSKVPIKLIPPTPEDGIDPSDSGSESEEEDEVSVLNGAIKILYNALTCAHLALLYQNESGAESYATDTSSGWTSEEELELEKQPRKATKKIPAEEKFNAIRTKNEIAPGVSLLPSYG